MRWQWSWAAGTRTRDRSWVAPRSHERTIAFHFSFVRSSLPFSPCSADCDCFCLLIVQLDQKMSFSCWTELRHIYIFAKGSPELEPHSIVLLLCRRRLLTIYKRQELLQLQYYQSLGWICAKCRKVERAVSANWYHYSCHVKYRTYVYCSLIVDGC